MIAIKLKHVQRHKGRDGKVRYYFRKPGLPRKKLPDPDESGFWEAYHAALHQIVEIKPERYANGTLAALADDWMRTPAFLQLGPATRKNYTRLLSGIQKEDFALHQIDLFEAQHIRRFVARKADTPAAANHRLRLFRLIFAFAVEDGRIKSDPTAGVKRLKEKGEGAKSWTEDEIARFEDRWPTGSTPRLALALLLYTGQRRSDVVKMRPQDVVDGMMSVQQVKTGTRLFIPIHPLLAIELASVPESRGTYLETAFSKPFSPDGFAIRFAKWCSEARLEGLSPHGLRKAAARRMAEAGCTAHQIASITGHRTLAEVQRYTLAADQKRLAEEAMAKIGSTTSFTTRNRFTKPED
ncbi:site-specific integrase [Acetobacter aceti]|uniref:Integrase n=1 Tax=Acetobacter aceti TaxID=435 RepID=A0A6S6PGJ9_ACEAC|nr:tyrosine-type recombinase/integrase [Acetobacter aceti]BCI68137.1 integrase [Acetobacter aceti]